MKTICRLFGRALLLAAMIGATLAAMTLIPFQEPTYFDAAIDKERRLAGLPPGKVILLGGSNLAFGVDSRMIESALHRPVVNMGLHAEIGLRLMLDLVRPHIAGGDVIVISPEYELFYLEPHLTEELCSTLLRLPQPWRYAALTDVARCGVIAVGNSTQPRFLWMVRKAAGVRMRPPERSIIYRRESFNDRGDVEAHLGRPSNFRPGVPARAIPLAGPPRAKAIDALADFTRFALRRGAIVAYAEPVQPESFYLVRRTELRRLRVALRSELPEQVHFISGPEDFVFPDAMFFDTVYHLTAPARTERTLRLIRGLAPFATRRAGS